MTTTIDAITVNDESLIVRDDDDVFVLELDTGNVTSRTRLGAPLAAEVETWNFQPANNAASHRREKIASRLASRPGILEALSPVPISDRSRHSMRMNEARRFAELYDDVIPLPYWHRLALAKHALFRQQYITWGIADPAAHWPLHNISMRSIHDSPLADRQAVFIVNDLAVCEDDLVAFERTASANGLTRLHFYDDGFTLKLGPTLEGRRLGEFPDRLIDRSRSVPLNRLTAALIESELTKIAPRISAALVGEASLTKGQVFRLDWRTMGAEERRITR